LPFQDFAEKRHLHKKGNDDRSGRTEHQNDKAMFTSDRDKKLWRMTLIAFLKRSLRPTSLERLTALQQSRKALLKFPTALLKG
jgi:hypothetical protein